MRYFIIFFPIAILLRSGLLNLYIITGCLIFIYRIFNRKEKIFNIDLRNILIIFLIFIFYNFCSSFFSINTDQALQSAFSQLRFIFFAYFISTLSINPKNLEKIFQFTLIILFIVSLDTLLQFFTGKDIFGFTGDPINPGRLSGPLEMN